MPPLPANSTARLFVDYVTGTSPTSQEHTLQVRLSGNSQQAAIDAQSNVLSVLEALTPAAFPVGWQVFQCRFQAQGSDFSVPIGVIESLRTLDTSGDALPPREEPREYTFQGRSLTSGRRVDVSVYGLLLGTPDNYRILASQSGLGLLVSGAVANLQIAGANGAFLAVDGTAPRWQNYVNVNYNSYWERRIRSV